MPAACRPSADSVVATLAPIDMLASTRLRRHVGRGRRRALGDQRPAHRVVDGETLLDRRRRAACRRGLGPSTPVPEPWRPSASAGWPAGSRRRNGRGARRSWQPPPRRAAPTALASDEQGDRRHHDRRPAGVSKRHDARGRPTAASAPTATAPAAIASGVRAKARAAAAGHDQHRGDQQHADDLQRHRDQQRQRQRQDQPLAPRDRPRRPPRDPRSASPSSSRRQRQATSATTSAAPPQITARSAARHREDVAEEIADQVDPHPGRKLSATSPARERRVRGDAEQRVGRIARARRPRDGQRHRQRRRPRRPTTTGSAGRERQRHPEQRGMRGGVAEIGHPPPDDEAAERPGRQRDADPGEHAPGRGSRRAGSRGGPAPVRVPVVVPVRRGRARASCPSWACSPAPCSWSWSCR